MSLLQLVKPIARFLPEVPAPQFKVAFRERVIWTSIALFIFLICCQIPLYGVKHSDGSDPFGWLRVILASNRGTLMELGISPIVTSSMIIQLLTGLKIIYMDPSSREDRQLYGALQKLLAIVLTVCEAIVYVYSGMYGDINELGIFKASIIIVQLIAAGFVVLILDDVLQKGYGLGSGISLFIATNICESILWKAFSPITINNGKGTEFEGAFVALFHLICTRHSIIQALYEAFFRSHLPNMMNLIATGIVFLVVSYLQGFKIDLRVSVSSHRGLDVPYSIKLFYTSTTPIILLTSCISNMYFLSRFLSRTFPGNILVNILGTWEMVQGQAIPRGGIAYYISPPTSITNILYDPIHAVLYTIFMIGASCAFSLLWIEISGSSAHHVAKQFAQSNRTFKGFPPSATFKILNQYIPTAAALGGIFVGILTIFADLLGAIGSGTGILLAVNIIYQYYEVLVKDKDPSELE